MKVLVLNGSPKKNSDTMCLTKAFLRGIEKSGSHSIEIVNVIEKVIHPCTGCFACWKLQNGKCVQNDDQNEILEKIKDADVILWSFPLYCYGMPSHLKTVVDRLIPFMKMSMTEQGGVVRHDALVDLSAKHFVVLAGCGFPHWNGNFEGLRMQCRNLFPDHLTMVCVTETPLLNVLAAEPLTTPLLEKFEKAGAHYARNLSLSDEILASLETPMLPNDTYIQMVNAL